MGKDRDDSNPTKDVVHGLGLLFRAGQKAAGKLKKGFDRSHLARSLDDAGKEVARAADNVVNRIAGEVKKAVKDLDGTEREPPGQTGRESGPPPPSPNDPTAGSSRPQGRRIAVDDSKKE
jgi:hypothetical protein